MDYDRIVNYMMDHQIKHIDPIKKKKTDLNDINEEQAVLILGDLIDVFEKYNLSYRSACIVSTALTEALLTGAVELSRENR